MNLETLSDDNPTSNGYEKIVDRKVVKVMKHFGGRHTTYHYNDGTESNVYSDFRPGIDNPDPTKPISDLKKAELEKRYKLKQSDNTMKTANTATATTNASTKATKTEKVPVAKPVKKDAAAPAVKAPKAPKVDADAAKVIADFATNPLPSEFTEQQVYDRLGRWNATLYRWVRENAVKTGNRISGKSAYALKADMKAAA